MSKYCRTASFDGYDLNYSRRRDFHDSFDISLFGIFSRFFSENAAFKIYVDIRGDL